MGHSSRPISSVHLLFSSGREHEMRLHTWTIYPPNSYSFEVHAYNEMQAREQARFYLGVQKLPKGTEVFISY